MITIKDLKERFQNELDSIYGKEEATTFFYLLSEHKLGLKRVAIAIDPDLLISTDNEQYFLLTINELKKEIPIQYIIGETEFFGIPFYVNQDVLIPRPETEELVQWVLESNAKHQISNPKILDIGTGSGCIAIALAKNIPKASVWALDVSLKALKIAEKNARHNKVEIQFIEEDILKTIPLENLLKNRLKGSASKNKITSSLSEVPIAIGSGTPGKDQHKFDIIISNPPYVRELEKEEIKNNVLQNEPHVALFVKDENPLLFYDKIADVAKEILTQNGKLYFEINQYLGKKTIELLKKKGFKNVELRKDIFGKDRMIFSSFVT